MTSVNTASPANPPSPHTPWTPPAPQPAAPRPAPAAGSPAFVAPSPGARPAEPKPRGNARAKTPQQLQLRRLQWSLVPVVGLAAAVGVGYRRAFEADSVLPVVAVAAVAPVLLVFLWSGTGRMARPTRRPRPLLGSLAFGVLGWLVAVSATLYRDHATAGVLPGPALLRRIGGDVLDAPRGVLTTVLPAPGDAELLVLVSLSVWLAAYAGAELALRTTSVVLPALPGLLLLAVPVVLSTGAPGTNTVTVAVAAGAAVLLMVCRAPGRRTPVRTLSVGLPLMLAFAVLAAFVGPRLPGVGSPPDLRDQVSPPPPVRLVGTNPLDRISAWLLTPDQPLFTVEAPAPENRYWRLAVMDRYDGVSWYPTTELRPTGGRVPPAEGVDDQGSRTRMRVTLDKLDGVWLPAADRPDRVSTPDDVDLAVDPASGVLATGDLLHAGLTYDVDARVKEFDPDRLQFLAAVADPEHTALPDRDVASEPIPDVDEFRRIAAEATAGATFPYQQALRLADWLRKNQRYDITAVPGHSYRNLLFFLESSKEGTSEQFAAAFAVLARCLGLPSRVVVGFSRGTATGPDTWRVDSGDVVAWPEVEFEGVGWVPFFPTPGQAGQSGEPKTDPGNAPPPAPQAPPPGAEQADEQSRAEKDQQILDQVRPPAAAGQAPDAGDDGLAVWWWAVPAALALLFASGHLGLAWAAPGIVRRRRTRGPPDRRIYGAWRHISDRLAEIGMARNGALTAREVAYFGEEHLPEPTGSRLHDLADLVNDLAYAGRTADAAQADEAWHTAAEVDKAVRASDARPRLRARVRSRLAFRRLRNALRGEGG